MRRKRKFLENNGVSYDMTRKKNNDVATQTKKKHQINHLFCRRVAEENKELKEQLLALKLRVDEIEKLKPSSTHEKPGKLANNHHENTSVTKLIDSPKHPGSSRSEESFNSSLADRYRPKSTGGIKFSFAREGCDDIIRALEGKLDLWLC